MSARRSTGGVVIDTRRRSPVFALRFRAYGQRQYITLGNADEDWTRDKAEQALRHTFSDVERGIWRPPDRETAQPAPEHPKDPTFHEFASEWFRDHESRWRPNTRLDYQWQLTHHLLPFFAQHRLSQITAREIDRYTAAKVREAARLAEARAEWQARLDRETDGRKRRELQRQRPADGLSATSINKTVTRLGQILKRAKRWKLIAENPVQDAERLKESRPTPIWLDRAEHIAALLDAAGQLDAKARRDRQHVERRAILATLVLAGLRIGELCELRWRDVDLSAGRLTVRESKTAAGVRQVDMLPALRSVLEGLSRRRPDDLVFATSNGQPHGASNIRRRVLAPAVKLANERLEHEAEVPLPERLTPHKLRHTFASILVALGVDPGSVMDQPGTQIRRSRSGCTATGCGGTSSRRTRCGTSWAARIGQQRAAMWFRWSSQRSREAPGHEKTPPERGFRHGRGWARTSDLSRVKRALSH
jgi:integrase